jgi:hypothetical protein
MLTSILIALNLAFSLESLPGFQYAYSGLLFWSDYAALSRTTRSLFGQPCILEDFESARVAYAGFSLSYIIKQQLADGGNRVYIARIQRGYKHVDRVVVLGPRREVYEVINRGRESIVRGCVVFRPGE